MLSDKNLVKSVSITSKASLVMLLISAVLFVCGFFLYPITDLHNPLTRGLILCGGLTLAICITWYILNGIRLERLDEEFARLDRLERDRMYARIHAKTVGTPVA